MKKNGIMLFSGKWIEKDQHIQANKPDLETQIPHFLSYMGSRSINMIKQINQKA
jgi:hypothetical protein